MPAVWGTHLLREECLSSIGVDLIEVYQLNELLHEVQLVSRDVGIGLRQHLTEDFDGNATLIVIDEFPDDHNRGRG